MLGQESGCVRIDNRAVVETGKDCERDVLELNLIVPGELRVRVVRKVERAETGIQACAGYPYGAVGAGLCPLFYKLCLQTRVTCSRRQNKRITTLIRLS